MKEDSTGRIAFGKRLARKRKQMKLTQEELALKAGLDRVTINRIENGKFNVGLDILNKIGTALGAELDYADVLQPWDTKFYDRDTKQEITEEEYIKRYSGTKYGEEVKAKANGIVNQILQTPTFVIGTDVATCTYNEYELDSMMCADQFYSEEEEPILHGVFSKGFLTGIEFLKHKEQTKK
ncbi:MAG: helix-turn-helix transcriptional regulator [Paludibacter sp.]|nr:helix-turn-helix transcriptional regulator [Paludibacter sp.]